MVVEQSLIWHGGGADKDCVGGVTVFVEGRALVRTLSSL